MNLLKTYLLLVSGMIIFGSGTPISKLVTQDFPVFLASGLRMFTALLLFLPVFYFKKREIKLLSKKEWVLLFLLALIGLFAFSVFMLYGMKQVSGVVGSIIMSATPAVTALAAFLIFKEKMTWQKIVAILLAVAGILIIDLKQGAGSEEKDSLSLVLGSLLVFAAVCSEATFTLLGKRILKKISPLLLMTLVTFLASLLFLPFSLYQAVHFSWTQVNPPAFLAVVWWGIGTMALGSYCWYRGVQQAEGAEAAAFMGLMPLSALVLSYLLLNETFQWIHLLGFGFVFVSVGLVAWSHILEKK